MSVKSFKRSWFWESEGIVTRTDQADDKQSLGKRCRGPRGTGEDAGTSVLKGWRRKRARGAIFSASHPRVGVGWRGSRPRFLAAKAAKVALFPKNHGCPLS